MIKLIDILKEIQIQHTKEEIRKVLSENFAQDILDNGIEKGKVLTLYHAGPNPLDRNRRTPIHLGTGEQTDDIIDMFWDDYPKFYDYKVKIKLQNPYPEILMDVDQGAAHTTEDFTKYGDYNEFIYHNNSEGYPSDPTNLSVFIKNFKRSYVDMKLQRVINTTSIK